MTDNFSKTLDWGLRCVLVGAVPPTIGLLCLAGPILTTLMRHGQFNDFDVMMTTRSLMAFAVGLPAMMAVKVLASAFYSRHDIKTPVKVAALVLVVGVGLNFLLIKPLAHAGLALATSLTTSLNALLLLIILVKLKVYRPSAVWLGFGLRISLATVLMATVLYYLSGTTQQWLQQSILANAWHLSWLIIVGAITYFASLILSGMRLHHLAPPAD
jgi:putative peptidoglycan lipid II flippase